jgi:hypothetical protein
MKITCTCGCIITKRLLSNHKKTQKLLMKIGVLKHEFIDDNGRGRDLKIQLFLLRIAFFIFPRSY